MNDKAIYELTITRARWLSKKDKPMLYYAAWLRNHGYKVAYVREYYLGVYATADQVASALRPRRYEAGAMLRRDVPRLGEDSASPP